VAAPAVLPASTPPAVPRSTRPIASGGDTDRRSARRGSAASVIWFGMPRATSTARRTGAARMAMELCLSWTRSATRPCSEASPEEPMARSHTREWF